MTALTRDPIEIARAFRADQRAEDDAIRQHGAPSMNINQALEVLAAQMEDRGGELVLNHEGGEVMAAWVIEGVDMTLAGGETAQAAIINLAEAMY